MRVVVRCSASGRRLLHHVCEDVNEIEVRNQMRVLLFSWTVRGEVQQPEAIGSAASPKR
jgi:hypothetical protein